MTSQSGLEARVRNGDGRAFGELIRQCDDDLRRVAWSVVRSASETDDVMQSTYEKAFRSLGNFRHDSSFKTWLTSICLRTAIDHSKYERRRRHDSDSGLVQRTSADSTSRSAISKAELARVLDRLDPETRSLLMMTVGVGFSFDEAAEITGLPRGTVASRVARAKKLIRRTNQPVTPPQAGRSQPNE